MKRRGRRQEGHAREAQPPFKGVWKKRALVAFPAGIAIFLVWALFRNLFGPAGEQRQPFPPRPIPGGQYAPTEKWLQRAYAVDVLFHAVYTPCWEGAYGAIGDAYLFGATRDSALLRFHSVSHNMTLMCAGGWVDDRAWICLAELAWWRLSGRRETRWVADARHRYDEVREQGRLSTAEGYWSWYNWPPDAGVPEKIFSNSNMNQMASVACGLFEATGDRRYLDDALLVWNGDARYPGIERTYYKGNGAWEGKGGSVVSGDPLPWKGAGYGSLAAALFKATGDPRYRRIAVATAKRLMDPAYGWVDPIDFYQLRMDGNGAFVNFILDAYMISPEKLRDIPDKIGKMLEHVWTNAHGSARVTLHRERDHGIRNGWNPRGGEEGLNVNDVGTVHAQAEAVRAFGVYAYIMNAPQFAAEKHANPAKK